MHEIFQEADDYTLKNNIKLGLNAVKIEMLNNFTVSLQMNNPPGLESSIVMMYFRPNLPAHVSNQRDKRNMIRKEYRLRALRKQWAEEKKEEQLKKLKKAEDIKNKLKYKEQLLLKAKEKKAKKRQLLLEKKKLKKIDDKRILSEYKNKANESRLKAKELLKKHKARYIEIPNEENNK